MLRLDGIASVEDAEQQRGGIATPRDERRGERRLEHLSEQVLELRRWLFCIKCIHGACIVGRSRSHFRKLYSESENTSTYAEHETMDIKAMSEPHRKWEKLVDAARG